MHIDLPAHLAAACGDDPARRAWLARLPDAVRELSARWTLTLDAPYGGDEVSCSWVAPALRANGTRAILKLGMPHMEAEDEIAGLRFWAGDPTALLLEADETLNAMLLERCEPGTPLRRLPEPEQDIVIAGLLRRLWRRPPASHTFRPLALMCDYWARETREDSSAWPDDGLVREGLRLLDELPRSAPDHVLLATDLHAGNVLAAQREPWLVIDPKPFVGDPGYDATQHLLNCHARLLANPLGLIERLADLLALDRERLRLWTFARVAIGFRERWDTDLTRLARALA